MVKPRELSLKEKIQVRKKLPRTLGLASLALTGLLPFMAHEHFDNKQEYADQARAAKAKVVAAQAVHETASARAAEEQVANMQQKVRHSLFFGYGYAALAAMQALGLAGSERRVWRGIHLATSRKGQVMMGGLLPRLNIESSLPARPTFRKKMAEDRYASATGGSAMPEGIKDSIHGAFYKLERVKYDREKPLQGNNAFVGALGATAHALESLGDAESAWSGELLASPFYKVGSRAPGLRAVSSRRLSGLRTESECRTNNLVTDLSALDLVFPIQEGDPVDPAANGGWGEYIGGLSRSKIKTVELVYDCLVAAHRAGVSR
ncbi:MAG: hypothetical protein JNK33_00020 [Candidatus Doudnabacteria bacterium]|nr:hypothetical protein [Candidatus Doudnabacteria bacterium]